MLTSTTPTPSRARAAGYINHNPFVAYGREANRAFWAAFFTAFPTSPPPWTTSSRPVTG